MSPCNTYYLHPSNSPTLKTLSKIAREIQIADSYCIEFPRVSLKCVWGSIFTRSAPRSDFFFVFFFFVLGVIEQSSTVCRICYGKVTVKNQRKREEKNRVSICDIRFTNTTQICKLLYLSSHINTSEIIKIPKIDLYINLTRKSLLKIKLIRDFNSRRKRV